MRSACLVLRAVIGLTVPGNSISAQSEGAVSSNAPIRMTDAEVSEDGTVKIRFNDQIANAPAAAPKRLIDWVVVH